MASKHPLMQLKAKQLNSNNASKEIKINNLSTSSTVEELKKAIAKEIGDLNGWDGLKLSSEAKDLVGNKNPLSNYKLEHDATIHYTRGEVTAPMTKTAAKKALGNLLFKSVEGRTYILHSVENSITVAAMRERLGEEKGIEAVVNETRFIWSGKQLEDHKTLRDYGINEVIKPLFEDSKTDTS